MFFWYLAAILEITLSFSYIQLKINIISDSKYPHFGSAANANIFSYSFAEYLSVR